MQIKQDKIEVIVIGKQKKIVRILNQIEKSPKRLAQEAAMHSQRLQKKIEIKQKAQGLFFDRCSVCGVNHPTYEAVKHQRVGFCSRRCQRKQRIGALTKGRAAAIGSRRDRQLRRQEKKKEPAVEFYSSDAWRTVRFSVLRKFGYCCLACGRKPPDVVLHVDHIKPRSIYPKLELDFDNLQVLCEDCNLGKSNRSQDDLRPAFKLVDPIK